MTIPTKFTALMASVLLTGGAAVTLGSTGAVTAADETDSPTPEVSDTPEATPTVEAEETPDVESTPEGKAYGWWRNHGVIKDKPGNGPKPNAHAEANAGGDVDDDDGDDGDD